MDAKSDEIGAFFGWIDCFFLSIIYYNIETAGGGRDIVYIIDNMIDLTSIAECVDSVSA